MRDECLESSVRDVADRGLKIKSRYFVVVVYLMLSLHRSLE